MTTTERLARFETAQEILGFLMAACAEWIYIESKKAQPAWFCSARSTTHLACPNRGDECRR